MLLGTQTPRDEHVPADWKQRLRARLRKRPCAIGWHQFVLTYDGLVYKNLCEHCGRPEEAR